MQCSINRSCFRVFILVGFICTIELVFGLFLAVCVVGLFPNIG